MKKNLMKNNIKLIFFVNKNIFCKLDYLLL